MADEPLRLILELDSKIKNLLGLDKKLGAAAGAADKAEEALKGMAEAADHAGNALGHLGGGVGGFVKQALAHFAALAAEHGLEAIGEKVGEIAREMITTIAQARNLDRAFTTLFKPDEAKEMDEWIEKIKDHTRFDDDDLKKFAIGLKRAGVAAKDIPDALRAGLDITELIGGDPKAALDQVGSFFEGLATRGEVAFRQLGAVGITKPELLKDLAAQTGDSIADIEKKLSAGQVSIDRLQATIFKEITQHTGKALGAVGVEGGNALDAQIERFKRQPEEWFKTLAKNPAIDHLSNTFGTLAKNISPEGPIGSQIVGGLTTLVQSLDKALQGIDVKEVMGQIAYWVEVGVAGFKLMVGTVEAVSGAFKWFGEQIGESFAFLYMGVEKTLGFLRYIGEWLTDTLMSGQLFTKIGEAALSLGTAIWEGIKKGLLAGASFVADAMGEVVSGMLGKVTGMLGIHSPSRVLMEIGGQTGEGFARGLEGTQTRVDDVAGETFQVDASARTSARPMGGPVSVNVPITVNWSGGGGREEDAQALAERLRDLIPGQLQAALEQLGLEMGAG